MDSPVPTISVGTSALDALQDLDPHPSPRSSPHFPTYARPRQQHTLNYSRPHPPIQIHGAQAQDKTQTHVRQLLSVVDLLARQEREVRGRTQQGQHHHVRDGVVVESSGLDADTEAAWCSFLLDLHAHMTAWSLTQPADPLDGRETINSTLWMKDDVEPLLRIFAGCIIGIVLMSAAVLKSISLRKLMFKSSDQAERSGVRVELRLSHSPCFAHAEHNGVHARRPKVLEILDDDKLDREWVVRNVLDGMAAGFGLQVVLNI
ncbi:uncharacterized protein FOMMEDRAFT_156347 [Fomitiporia mediterranea MF3/22]|uniref:uncharacterized protein n=1 Tax=Fomitiporia mediterranea (strain MF3/22) TaxID=694068 RepID=UPI0004408012|nr:uncharacterized protein FOMMEDRAFT_156347 [Fomitiporia mediterranea MF3/22]EJD02989.1 hypothetical protein FOMMEDRAFT_156347 [Fomitiporia mediterranea MF3/22]